MDSQEKMTFFAGLKKHFNPQAPVNSMSGVQDQPILKIPLIWENCVVKVRIQEDQISENLILKSEFW